MRIRMEVGTQNVEWDDWGIWRPYELDMLIRHQLKAYDIYPRNDDYFTVDLNLDTVVW